MKGLLLKDYYMTIKYCRSYLIIVAVFILISLFSNENFFFIFYPCMISTMLPITLLGYDERSKWNEYIGTLPYKKSQIVTEKYLFGLIVQLFVFALIAVSRAVGMNIDGEFVWKDYIVLMSLVFILSCVSSSVCLPFIYKLGVEKGRIAYYVLICIVCAGGAVATNVYTLEVQKNISLNMALPLLCVAGIALYVLSWYLSIIFYKNREYNCG